MISPCLKIITLMGIFLGIISPVYGISNSLLTYTNNKCGYQIEYPQDATLQSSPADLHAGFYLNPIQFIDDLRNNPQFKNAVLDQQCITKITLPIALHTNLDAKYLIILKLSNVPEKSLLLFNQDQNRKWNVLNLGEYKFYQIHNSDAAMCHQYEADYYFLKQQKNYYVLEFLFTAHCLGVKDNEIQYDLRKESKDFDAILRSFKII